MAKIDVIMPVKDGPCELPSAIISILSQSEPDIQLIIVNDGSGPEAIEIMRRFADQDNRVKVLNACGTGIVNALNTGLDYATAPYIARMDGDDIALPLRLAIQHQLMEQRPEVCLCGTTVMRFGTEFSVPHLPANSEDCRLALQVFNAFYHPTVMIRRSVMIKHLIRYSPEYEYAEDFKLFCELAAVGEVVNVNEPLLLYRVHDGQVSNTKLKAQQRSALNVVADLLAGDAQPSLGRDIRALGTMLICSRKLGRPHFRRSVNAIKNALWAVLNTVYPTRPA